MLDDVRAEVMGMASRESNRGSVPFSSSSPHLWPKCKHSSRPSLTMEMKADLTEEQDERSSFSSVTKPPHWTPPPPTLSHERQCNTHLVEATVFGTRSRAGVSRTVPKLTQPQTEELGLRPRLFHIYLDLEIFLSLTRQLVVLAGSKLESWRDSYLGGEGHTEAASFLSNPLPSLLATHGSPMPCPYHLLC